MHRTTARVLSYVGLFAALTAAGCSSDKDHEGRRSIVANPSSGPLAGGTQTVLEVRGFVIQPGASVTIGGEVAQVLSQSSTTVTVVTPAAVNPGMVEVMIESSALGAVSFSRPDVFEYLAPGQAPTGGGGTTGGGTTGGGTTPTPSSGFVFVAGTDKWWVAVDDPTLCDADQDGTPDLEQVLQFAADNTGGQGAWSGQMFAATDILLSHVSQYYLNNPDGSLAQGGIKISFQREEPTVGSRPASGDSERPNTTDDYNVMSLHHLGGTGGTTGRAIADTSGSNSRLENDSGFNGSTGNSLGTFVDREVQFWNSGGISTSQRTLESFMRLTAGTVAHEVGHSLGLEHTTRGVSAPATVNIMSASSIVDPSEVFGFDSSTINFLSQVLPGAGRCQHPAAWTPRWLVAESDAVVIGTALRLADGQLTLQLHDVLQGELRAGEAFEVSGFNAGEAISPEALAELGRCVWFLQASDDGFRFVGAEAEVIPMQGRSEAEWAQLVADYARLGDMRGLQELDRDLPAYLDVLSRSLASDDNRIATSALVELSIDGEAVRALSAEQFQGVADVAADVLASDDLRALALQSFVHRADAANADLLQEIALSSDSQRLIQSAAGALEMSLGLQAAGARVLAEASGANARVLLGWLQCTQATGFVSEGLASDDVAQVRAAADALGRIADASALEALRAVALNGELDLVTRKHALRAIGQIGDAAWLTEQHAAADAELKDAFRFARDFAGTWIVR